MDDYTITRGRDPRIVWDPRTGRNRSSSVVIYTVRLNGREVHATVSEVAARAWIAALPKED